MQSRSRSTFIFPWQPNPSNKLAIIHILGLLSNLFTTLDISHHDDDHESTEVKKLPVQQGPNPVSTAVARCCWPQPSQAPHYTWLVQERETGRGVSGECSVCHEGGSWCTLAKAAPSTLPTSPQWAEVGLRIPRGRLEDSPGTTCQPQAVPGCFSTEESSPAPGRGQRRGAFKG